jgi:hypothetical protein
MMNQAMSRLKSYRRKSCEQSERDKRLQGHCDIVVNYQDRREVCMYVGTLCLESEAKKKLCARPILD